MSVAAVEVVSLRRTWSRVSLGGRLRPNQRARVDPRLSALAPACCCDLTMSTTTTVGIDLGRQEGVAAGSRELLQFRCPCFNRSEFLVRYVSAMLVGTLGVGDH